MKSPIDPMALIAIYFGTNPDLDKGPCGYCSWEEFAKEALYEPEEYAVVYAHLMRGKPWMMSLPTGPITIYAALPGSPPDRFAQALLIRCLDAAARHRSIPSIRFQ